MNQTLNPRNGRGDENTTLGFPQTSLSRIAGARSDVAERLRLCESYYEPLRLFLERRMGEDAARDLLHDFFLKEMIRPDDVRDGRPGPVSLLDCFDPNKGRFRHFLSRRLRWFLTDRHRKLQRERRRTRSFFDDEAADVPDAAAVERTPSQVWARVILGRALRRLRRESESEAGAGERWVLLRERVVRPLLRQATAPGFADILEMVGLIDSLDAKEASNKVVNARRRLAALLREVVAEYVVEVDAEMELLDLFAAYAGGLTNKDRPAILAALRARRVGEEDAPTVAELLRDPAPSFEAFERVRLSMRALEREIGRGDLSEHYREPARVIYFACKAVARLRLGRSLGSGDERSLDDAAAWALNRGNRWIDAETRALFQTYLETFS